MESKYLVPHRDGENAPSMETGRGTRVKRVEHGQTPPCRYSDISSYDLANLKVESSGATARRAPEPCGTEPKMAQNGTNGHKFGQK